MILSQLTDNQKIFALILSYPDDSDSFSVEFSGETRVKWENDFFGKGIILLDCPYHDDIILDENSFMPYKPADSNLIFTSDREAKIIWVSDIDSNIILVDNKEDFNLLLQGIAAEEFEKSSGLQQAIISGLV